MGWDFSHPILFISWIFMGKFPFRVSTSNTRSAIRIKILSISSFSSKISFRIRSWNIFVVCAKISFIYQFFILISSQCNWLSSLDLYLIDSNNLCRGYFRDFARSFWNFSSSRAYFITSLNFFAFPNVFSIKMSKSWGDFFIYSLSFLSSSGSMSQSCFSWNFETK